MIRHVAAVADVFAERVRRCMDEDEPRLPAIPEDDLGGGEADPVALCRRVLRAHQRIIQTLAAPGAADRPAIHGEWGRVTAGYLAAYHAQHSHEHVAQLAREFPPK